MYVLMIALFPDVPVPVPGLRKFTLTFISSHALSDKREILTGDCETNPPRHNPEWF